MQFHADILPTLTGRKVVGHQDDFGQSPTDGIIAPCIQLKDVRLRPFKGDELIVFFRLLCGRSFRPFLRLIRLFRYLLILKADNLKVLNNDLCLAITAGSVEQDIDLLTEFDQFKRIRCFPDPSGIRIPKSS